MKILIADDDPLCTRALERVLRQNHYEVVTARSGSEAWDVLKRPSSPPMAIVDWMMPGMTGVDLCARVRLEADTIYRYLILVTGRAEPGAAVQALNAGADDLIGKPWVPEEVLARVQAGQRVVSRAQSSAHVFKAVLDEALRSAGGEVVVRSGDDVGRVFVHEGRIAWASLSSSQESFHDVLRSRVAIEPGEWQSLVRACQSDRLNVFEALIHWGLAERDSVTACLRSFIARRLRDMSHLPNLSALFLPGARPYSTELLVAPHELPALDSSLPPRQSPAPAPLAPATEGASVSSMRAAAARDLQPLFEINGALVVALIDLDSSDLVWLASDRVENVEALLRTQSRALRGLGGDDPASEMMASAGGVWHMLVRLPQRDHLCLYLALKHGTTIPAMARLKLLQFAATMRVSRIESPS